jgi:DNA-binding transcriptional LysR family regulator
MNGNDLDDVLAFLSVFEEGSFASAARALKRDASMVSRRVSALEARLRVRLLERSTRQLAPTEAGEMLYRRMRAAVSAMDEAEAEATDTGSVVTGLLRLAFPATFGRRWIVPFLPEFMKLAPKLRIEAEFSEAYVDLIENRFDAAIRVGSLADNRLVARKLAAHERILVASPDYLARHGTPSAPGDLGRYTCLINSRFAGHPNWRLESDNGAASVRVQSWLTSDESDSLLAAAVAGLGITVCATWLCARERQSGELVHVLPQWHYRTPGDIHLVRPSARYTPAKTRIFADWIAAKFSPPPWAL